MGDLWYPAAIRDPAPGKCWGTHADQGEPKFLLHTTEGPPGGYIPDPRVGDSRRYYGNTGTWPHYTLAIAPGVDRWRIFQHIPANRSAMSLRNRPGGVETNRDNTSQVEVAWRAALIRELPREAMGELARLLAWEHAVKSVPLVSAVRWVPYPASYGERAPQRLSPAEWDAYAGVLGHQHAPENHHGDPGDFPVDVLLALARQAAGVGRYAGMPTLRQGSRGREVVELQNTVNIVASHEDPGDSLRLAPDGVYGPRTERAVQAVQHGCGITADGVCGPATWQALGEALTRMGRVV